MNSRLKKVLVPFLVFLVFGLGVIYIGMNPVEARKTQPKKANPLRAEGLIVKKQEYQVVVDSYGSVTPHTQRKLAAKVGGEVILKSPNFKKGSFFQSGEVLLQIDPFDYELAYTNARIAHRELQYQNPAEDVELASLQTLQKAERDLDRTSIIAPFDGRILSVSVEVGDYLKQGDVLAELITVDYVEIPLPLNNRQINYLLLPETYRNQNSNEIESKPQVHITARIGSRDHVWEGFIDRIDGIIDLKTRTVYAYAQVNDPYRKRDEGQSPLKIGQFVKAEIMGKVLEDVFVIPRESIYREKEVLLSVDGKISRKEVNIIWTTENIAVLDSGLNEGDHLITTPLGSSVDGMLVTLSSVENNLPKKGAGGGNSRNYQGKSGDSSKEYSIPIEPGKVPEDKPEQTSSENSQSASE